MPTAWESTRPRSRDGSHCFCSHPKYARPSTTAKPSQSGRPLRQNAVRPAAALAKSKDPDQDTDQRRAEQIEAQRLILQHNWSASRGDDHRLTSSTYPVLKLVNGEIKRIDEPALTALNMRLRDDYTSDADVVGAINPSTGYLDLYTRSTAANHPSGDAPRCDVDDAPVTTGSGRGPSSGAQSPAADDDDEAAQADASDDGRPPRRAEALRGRRRRSCRAIAGKRAQRSSPCNPPMPNCSRC